MKLNEVLLENMLTQLLKMCKRELNLSELPEITMLDIPAVADGASFGVFDDSGIQVATRDRHPMDVMRTVAHELVHWKQRTENKEMDGTDGSNIENEANAVAGVIMRKFGKAHPECFVL